MVYKRGGGGEARNSLGSCRDEASPSVHVLAKRWYTRGGGGGGEARNSLGSCRGEASPSVHVLAKRWYTRGGGGG